MAGVGGSRLMLNASSLPRILPRNKRPKSVTSYRNFGVSAQFVDSPGTKPAQLNQLAKLQTQGRVWNVVKYPSLVKYPGSVNYPGLVNYLVGRRWRGALRAGLLLESILPRNRHVVQGEGAVVLLLHSHRLFLAPHMAMASIERYEIICI